MKNSTLVIFLLFASLPQIAQAQLPPRASILKFGFSTEATSFQKDGQYSLNLDLENATNSPYFTSEFGIGFLSKTRELPMQFPGSWSRKHSPEGFKSIGSEMYYTKFVGTFYPLSAIFGNWRYQGLYLSAGPGLYYESFDRKADHFGLGLFTSAGIQVFLSNRFSAAFEVEMNLLSNINSYPELPGLPPSNQNVLFSNTLKIGYLFNTPALKKKKSFL